VPAIAVYIEPVSPQSRSVTRPSNLVSATLTFHLTIFILLTLSLKHLLLHLQLTRLPIRHHLPLPLLALVPRVSSAQPLSS